MESPKIYAYFEDGRQEEITAYRKIHDGHIQFSTCSGVYLYKSWTSGMGEQQFAFYRIVMDQNEYANDELGYIEEAIKYIDKI